MACWPQSGSPRIIRSVWRAFGPVPAPALPENRSLMHRCRYLTNFGQSANLYSRTIIGRGDAGDQQHVAIDYANENPPDRHCLHFVCRAADYPYTAFATTLEDALRAALSNSLSLSASRNNWAAARDNIDGAQSTEEWRATGTLSGTQSMTNAATATRDGF